MRVAVAVVVAGLLALPIQAADIASKPLLLRSGIDDLGMTVAEFVRCIEGTIDEAVASGMRTRPNEPVQLRSVERGTEIVVPGINRDVYLDIKEYNDFAIVWRVRVGNVASDTDPDAIYALAVMLGDSCIDL